MPAARGFNASGRNCTLDSASRLSTTANASTEHLPRRCLAVVSGNSSPAIQLTMVIESAPDQRFVPNLIPLLAVKPLEQILEAPFVAPLLGPLLKRHEVSIDILKQRSECKDGTIFFDITDYDLEGYNKFVPYYLHPQSIYSVGLSKSSFRVKVSVGSNPWASEEPVVNLAKICERYGGGGHARVGAISFNVNQHAAAIRASQEIVTELRAAVRQRKA